MRARTLVGWIGVPSYLLFMVIAAPTSFIASRVTDETEGRVQFSDTRGTLWSGSARAHIDAPGGAVQLERVAWRLLPAKLFEGRIAFDVEVASKEASLRAELLRGWSEWEARGATARIAATLLPAITPIVAAWRPEGIVTASADDLRWNEREVHGPMTMEWRDAAVALSDVKPLGTYRITANGTGDTVAVSLSTLSGPLTASGKGDAHIPRGFSFSGEARAEPASAAALEPLLNLVGPRRPDGARSIEVRIR